MGRGRRLDRSRMMKDRLIKEWKGYGIDLSSNLRCCIVHELAKMLPSYVA